MGKHLALFDPAEPPEYDPGLARKFVRCLMGRGELSTARRIFDDALHQIKRRLPDADPLGVFTGAVECVKSSVEVRSKRVGGATYQVPMRVNRARQQTLAIRWIISAARGKPGRPMHVRLAEEIVAVYLRTGEGSRPT